MSRSGQLQSAENLHTVSHSHTRIVPWALVAGIIFIAVNLRAPLTSVGPLVGLIRNDLHISNTLAGAITAVPLFAFALFSPIAPKLARRFKMGPVLLASIMLLTAGILIRSLSGTIALFIGTALLGLAISVCNVLLPSLIKREFPERIGIMTGIYTVSMNLCGAVASGISVPLAVGAGFGWQGALAVWGALSLISVLCWLPQTRQRPQSQTAVRQQPSRGETHLWRSPLAWQVTLFMGLQSLVFYVIITWLPEILGAQGIGPSQSGWLLSIMQLAVLPFTLAVPIIAGRMSNQRPLVYFSSVMFVIGLTGLLYGSVKLAVLWISVLGIGIGCVFSLAMMFFSLRTRTAQQAAELSGMAQSVGYLLAAIGPSFFGYLHDRSGSWTTPLWILFGVSVLMILFGISSAKQRYIDSP